MDIKLIDIATSNPKLKLTQTESLRILRRERRLTRKEGILYERFLLEPGINTRFFALDKIQDIFIEDQDILIRRFQKEAASLSISSLKRCIRQAGIRGRDIDCLIVTTCTGYLCPGLTSYIVENTNLRKDIYIADMVGMGCGGAIPAIQGAYNFLKANKDSNAVVVCTEICSSAISWGSDPELILSNSIFGDGSAACILTNKNNIRGLRFLDFTSKVLPKYRDELRFRIENSRLRNIIKITVPEIASSIFKEIVNLLLKRNNLKIEDIKFWAIHPGGRKVLDKIQNILGLNNNDLLHSKNVLYNYGNMSSPTVLYVLKGILDKGRPKMRDKVIAASFGAGFSGYSVLLESI